MKTQLKKLANYCPYKIFQKCSQINNNKKLFNFNSYEATNSHQKLVIDISKNIKSVAKSNKLFSDYMENYISLTQDYCFKSPDNNIYPIRKNFRYLSANSLKHTNYIHDKNKRKFSNRPFSVNTNNKRLKLFNINNNRSSDNKINIIKKNQTRNNNNDLLLSLTEGEFYKKNNWAKSGNNSIDLDNNKKLKKQHLDYLKNYLNKKIILNDIFDKTKLSLSNTLQKNNIQYELNIYSLCLKFRILYDDRKIKHKLYLKFKYLPIFYLLDYQTFKVFLSEIVFYDKISNNFAFIREKFDETLNKYYKYINSNLKDFAFNINDITFFKNEFSFPSVYKWIVYNKDIHNNEKNLNKEDKKKEENEKKTMIFELKIEMPKIKFKILKYETKIKNNLKKSLMIQLMKTEFFKWEELILFELFYIKKFRKIIYSILINRNKYYQQKINLLYSNYSVNQKDEIKSNINKFFEIYISEINDNFSNYYIFNPYIIILSSFKKNYYQEIHLTLKESKILYKYGKYWGIMNTLLKCINFNNDLNKKFNFKFDLLDNLSPQYLQTNENKNKYKKEQIKFSFNKFEITVYDCSLKKIIINNSQKVEKLLIIPKNFLKLILGHQEKVKKKIKIDENMVNGYCKEIREEKIFEIKNGKSLRKLNDREYENYDLLESNSKINSNKANSSLATLKEGEFKKPNFNKRVQSANIDSNQKIYLKRKVKNRDNEKLFLTKDFTKNNYEKENKENNKYISSSTHNYNDRNSFKNKTLYLIKNQKELERNRIISDIFYFNNEIEINNIKSTILSIRKKKYKSFKK